MKTLRTIIIIITVALSFCTCTKDADGDADMYVGVYSVSVVENVTWGGSSGTLTDNGTITITKLSSNQVKVTGYFSTTGRVSGSTINLEGMSTSDSSGSINTVFGTGIYNGGTITISSTRTGQLKSNGVMYPFTSRDQITAIKK